MRFYMKDTNSLYTPPVRRKYEITFLYLWERSKELFRFSYIFFKRQWKQYGAGFQIEVVLQPQAIWIFFTILLYRNEVGVCFCLFLFIFLSKSRKLKKTLAIWRYVMITCWRQLIRQVSKWWREGGISCLKRNKINMRNIIICSSL